MDGLSISLEIFIGLTSGIVSALGVWFKLKSTVEIQKIMLDNVEHDINLVNDRITRLKTTVEANREKNEGSLTELKKEINEMEIRIIKAIHEISNK
jgi:hypothetical protein